MKDASISFFVSVVLACVVIGVVLELSFVVSGDHVLIVLQGGLDGRWWRFLRPSGVCFLLAVIDGASLLQTQLRGVWKAGAHL